MVVYFVRTFKLISFDDTLQDVAIALNLSRRETSKSKLNKQCSEADIRSGMIVDVEVNAIILFRI